MCNITHLHVGHDSLKHDSFIRWHDSFARAKWLIRTCDMPHSYVQPFSVACARALFRTRLLHMCDMTYNSFICVTWLIQFSRIHTNWSFFTEDRSLVTHSRSCFTYDRSLLSLDMSLYTHDRSLFTHIISLSTRDMPLFQKTDYVWRLTGLFFRMLDLFPHGLVHFQKW